MTLALEFAAQDRQLTFAWNLPGIDHLEDPFVVLPSDPETAFDMLLVTDGLKLLAEVGTTEVPEAAIQEAMEHASQAREATVAHIVRSRTLRFMPDLNSPIPLGWTFRYVNQETLRSWHNEIAYDVFHSARPVFMEGPPAAAARLGLRTLAELGEPDCDPTMVAVSAGEVAVKYSGTQTLGAAEADEAYHATVAELDAAHAIGDAEEVTRLRSVLRWIVDHTVFRY